MDDFTSKVQDELNKIAKKAKETNILKLLGEKAVELIRKRTKLGYGVKTQGGTKSKLKPLSEGYKKVRKKTGVASSTSINKSNLTLTGEMLKDLKYEIEDGRIVVGWDEGSFSHDKAEWNTEKGRAFNNLSKAEIKQLRDFLEDLLKK